MRNIFLILVLPTVVTIATGAYSSLPIQVFQSPKLVILWYSKLHGLVGSVMWPLSQKYRETESKSFSKILGTSPEQGCGLIYKKREGSGKLGITELLGGFGKTKSFLKMNIEKLDLLGSGDACNYLGVKYARLRELVELYHIPHVILSCGMVFLKSDIEAFQKGREHNLKYARKKTR